MPANGMRHFSMPATPTCNGTRTARSSPKPADAAKINWLMTELILVIMVIYAAMVYGPVAAFLVELFPTRIRYTSMSLPYHIGAGCVRRHAAAARHRDRGRNRQYLLRTVVSDRGRRHDGRGRRTAAARHQGRRHPGGFGRRSGAARLISSLRDEFGRRVAWVIEVGVDASKVEAPRAVLQMSNQPGKPAGFLIRAMADDCYGQKCRLCDGVVRSMAEMSRSRGAADPDVRGQRLVRNFESDERACAGSAVVNGQQSLKTQVAAGPNTWQPVPEATAGHSLLGLTVPERSWQLSVRLNHEPRDRFLKSGL